MIDFLVSVFLIISGIIVAAGTALFVDEGRKTAQTRAMLATVYVVASICFLSSLVSVLVALHLL